MGEHGKSRRTCYQFRNHYKPMCCMKSCDLYVDNHQCCYNVPPIYWYTDRDWLKLE